VESAAQGAVVQGTNVKQTRTWNRFKYYLLSIGTKDDADLNNFSRTQKHKILGAFAHSIRSGRYGIKPARDVKSESVCISLDGVAQAFKLADSADPRLDIGGGLVFFLQRQLRGYATVYPPPSPQVAITATVLQEFYKLSISSYDTALCKLFMGAFFFAMRSCEYVQVSGTRKTKILAVRNTSFYKGKKLLNHHDPFLHFADCALICFELQKKGSKDDIITHHKSDIILLCPVKV
jgi:hypothetical protein